jgi:lysozyme
MNFNVIDVSRYQAGDDISRTVANACIVGLTYGGVGVNPYANDEINRARAAGMLTGLYHIRAGDGWTAAQEAQHFLDNATQYLDGQTPIFLDWEECTLSNIPWALAWCLYVFNQTGIMPVMYMSSTVSLQYDWSTVRNANIGLWVAQYPYNVVTGFLGVNWTPPATSWPNLVGWQYAGTGGAVGGYSGIDLSVFYLTHAQWVAYGTPAVTGQATSVTPIQEGFLMSLSDADQALALALLKQIAKYTDIKTSTVAGLAATAVWSEPVHRQYGDVPVIQDLATTGTNAINNNTALANLTAAVTGLPAAVLNQPFTTSAGVKTNVPGLLDAIHTKPVVAVDLTTDQIDQIAATLKAELPAATLSALAAKLAA